MMELLDECVALCGFCEQGDGDACGCIADPSIQVECMGKACDCGPEANALDASLDGDVFTGHHCVVPVGGWVVAESGSRYL